MKLALRLRSSDWLMLPFSLLRGGFACFREYCRGVERESAGGHEAGGIPFVLAGVYIIVGRFFTDSCQRSCTCQGVTEQRMIIVDGLFGRRVRSLADR